MLTYGNTNCQNCNGIHAVADHVTENLATKRRAKEIVFHLSQIWHKMGLARHLPGGGHITTNEARRPLIIGVLTAGPQTFVAHSGGPANAFNTAIQRIMVTLPGLIYAGNVTVPVATRGGTAVGAGIIAGCQAPGGNAPLSCAAPKLIDAANRDAAAVMPYHMSEVWFDARTYDRATVVTDARKEVNIAGVHTDHGRSRLSCATCVNVVPILMCAN